MSLDIASGQASTEPSSGLSKPTILLHWAVAICFLAVLFIGVYMVDLPRGPEKGEMIGLHKSLGVLVLVLAQFD
ncbi:cytochrome b561 [Vibrio ishigakensis]|uniref:Cytochrome b561 n=1 Tax=Vibrio ishigakensis TaxID=1481914 RepID=A0A0B8QBL6_9VIBR|nr:cytochrome b561 [Vibrio ishigakensis]